MSRIVKLSMSVALILLGYLFFRHNMYIQCFIVKPLLIAKIQNIISK